MFKNSAILFAIQSTGLVAQLLSQVMAARLMDSAQFGVFLQTRSWIQFLGMIAAWGSPVVTLQFLSVFLAKEDQRSIERFVRFLSVRTIALSVAVTLFMLVVVCIQPNDSAWAFMIGTIGIFVFASMLIFFQIGLVMDRIFLASMPYFLVPPFLFMSAMFLYRYIVDVPDALVANSFLVASLVLPALVQGIVLYSAMFLKKPSISNRARNDGSENEERKWSTAAFDHGISQVSGQVMTDCDIIIVGMYAGNEVVSLYGTANRLAKLASFGVSIINSTIAKQIAPLFSKHNVSGIHRLVMHATWFSTVVSILSGVLLWLFADFLLGFFGQAFLNAKPTLLVLLLGNVALGFAGPSGYVLSLTGRTRMNCIIASVCALLFVVLVLLGVFLGGAIGAAIASGVVFLSMSIVFAITIYREMGFVVQFPIRKAGAKDELYVQ